MDLLSCRARAGKALEQASYSPKKLIFLHTAVLLGAGLVVSLLNYLLAQGIGSTGGLGGLGNRALLSTLQSLLQLANLLLAPFWQIGLTVVALELIRGRQTGPGSLLAGFRHFGPVLRAKLLRGVLCFGVLMLAGQLAGVLFLMTPFARELKAVTEQMLASGNTDFSTLLEPQVLQDLTLKMLPFLLATSLLLLVPLMYRLRLMDYVLMDEPRRGAFFALRTSSLLMRGNCRKLFRLDLKFWWFYLLEMLTLAVCYGDVLLAQLGVTLPMSEAGAGIVFYLLGLACQLGLYVWKKDALIATYACAYEALLPPQPEVQI